MRVAWIRGSEHLRFNRPSTFFVLGVRGSGKSSFLEHVGEAYLHKGHSILDMFGSRDGEGLAWLRAPHAKDKKILLICGDNVDVACSVHVKNISKVRLNDFDRYDLLISASPLYSSPSDEFFQVNRLTDLLYRRLSWKKLVYVVVREAANLYYSRLRVNKNQLAAKAEATYMIREARHMGVALGLDTLKYTSIDIDVRTVLDYLILKSQGVLGLPDDLQWLYSFFSPHVVRRMPAGNFIIATRQGSLGLGEFPELEWHKREKENILRSVGLKIEYGEELHYGEDKRKFRTISDLEHVKIIALYSQGDSMRTIGDKLGRSSGAVHWQINYHDRAITRSGFCPHCRRAKGPHEKTKVKTQPS